MDTVGDEVWKSIRIAWREELWLPVGTPIAAVVYALWIGASGAAVGFLADAVIGGLTFDPWTGLTDLVVATLALFWVLGPAAIATLLVRDRVTNVRGNLATGYRLGHPVLLFLPPVAVLGSGFLALSQLGAAPWPVQAVLVVGAIWFLVRALAYSYRVFALSLPIVGHAIVFITTVLVAVATLILGAAAVGRGALAETVAGGLAARTGVEGFATLPAGSMELLGVAVPAVVGAIVVVPIGLASAYVAVQLVASLVARVLKPTVRRPQLRTGQRYPSFARPTTGASTATSSGGIGAAASTSVDGATAGSTDSDAGADVAPPETADETTDQTGGRETADETADQTGEAEPDVVTDVSHTRVYSPPNDADDIDPASVPAGSGGDADLDCPDCGTQLADVPADGTCPDCGAEL